MAVAPKISPQDVAEIAEFDLDFILALRRLGESGSTNPAVWGSLIQKHHDTDSVRRMNVRLFISYVESVVATLKAAALEKASKLSIGERSLLSDAVPDISDQGVVIQRPLLAPIQKNLRFGFKMYASTNGLRTLPDYGGDGWRAFMETVRVRNRITHPKTVADMVISDHEMTRVDLAHDWFMKSYTRLLHAHIRSLQRQIRRQRAKK